MTPDTNERAARILGWKRVRSGLQSKSDPEPKGWLPPSGNYREIQVACPNFTGLTVSFLALIAHAKKDGWHCTLDNSKGWACIFWKTDAKERSATDCEGTGETLQSAVCAAFLATFETEHPAV